MGIGPVEHQIRRIAGAGSIFFGDIAHRGQIVLDFVRIRAARPRADDGAKSVRQNSAVGDFLQPRALGFVADAARDVAPRRIRRDDAIATFEENIGADRHRLAAFGVACDLYAHHLSWVHAPALSQKARLTVRQAQEQPARAFERAVANCAIDGAGRGRIAID